MIPCLKKIRFLLKFWRNNLNDSTTWIVGSSDFMGKILQKSRSTRDQVHGPNTQINCLSKPFSMVTFSKILWLIIFIPALFIYLLTSSNVEKIRIVMELLIKFDSKTIEQVWNSQIKTLNKVKSKVVENYHFFWELTI